MYRSHHCGALTASDLDREVRLCGWVARVRDHGGVNFVDLRDRWGVTQVVFKPERNPELHRISKALRSEFCIAIQGVVVHRPKGTVNEALPTGRIEVLANELRVFSKSETTPFEIESTEKITEEVRLKYRYLDLRRASLRDAMLFRSRFLHEIRSSLHRQGFAEVETPVLTKSTPEGARDYLVPSRVNEGQFFALPQSPQLFKQLLMVSGFDRYFQIAKCFRDEDLRADRQPEFTQLDMEVSFVAKEDVFEIIEKLFKEIFQNSLNIKLTAPFKRISHQDAMTRFGTDKPDLRFELEIHDLSQIFHKTSLKIFKETLEAKGGILAIHVPRPPAAFSRKDFDEMIAYAQSVGAKGLAYMKFTDKGVESPIRKFLSDEEIAGMTESFNPRPEPGDILFFAADKINAARQIMGQVRLKLACKLGLLPKKGFSFLWVHDFPLFKYSEDTKRWDSEHHPFTGMNPEDIGKIGRQNSEVRSLSYDLVLNGNEIASGSVRIHDPEVQRRVFKAIGLDEQTAEERFGFLLSAFKYGPPPHAGIAVGLDRLVAIVLGKDSIREVIAFPKTQSATCLLTQAPSPVDEGQLKDLGIKVI